MTKTHVRRAIHAFLLAFILVCVALSMRTHAHAQFAAEYASTDTINTFPLCEHEYSVNCVWDAQIQGNGKGLSFVSIGTPDGAWNLYADGTTEFFPN